MDVVGLQLSEKVHQCLAEKRPLLLFTVFSNLLYAVFDVVANTLKEGVEQVFFVFEMPIQRAARYAGGLGDFIERSASDAFLVEGLQRGEHEMLFGFKGFGFGFPHEILPVSCIGIAPYYKKHFVSMQACMYNVVYN